MKNDSQEILLQHRLERATALDPPADPDPEVAAWRETWTAMGKLLDAGNALDDETARRLLEIAGVDEPALVSSERKKSNRNPASLPHRLWTRYRSIAVAAVVVSVLLSIAILNFAPNIVPMPNDDPRARDITLAWNDTLDYRMLALDERLTVAEYGSASLGNSFDSARLQLERLTLEIQP
jgi:hypothetical protein